ncbi:MAG: type IV pilus assembly protein PilM [Planctomycetota bacterium]|jgi:type IV pilus assembly protein PilM
MTSRIGTVWGVDVGNNCLKALHLSADERGTVEVVGFDNIEHGKILTGVGVTEREREELIALSLRRFVEQNDVGKDDIVVSVPSQNSFARFVSLPPVEQKRIPEVVKFEAAQQIPFDINDVQWDWQSMTEAGAANTKVGIFAIKSEVVDSLLGHFGRENMSVSCVQMAPMALYNYALYDRADLGDSANQAIIVLDIGAENTDLVVCTRSTVWQRCIPMGGNAFTRAIADAFKLNFQRAEKLKRTAPMSKYARQIFQAMRPVFTELASEIQRSLSFYHSSNPEAKLLKVIAFGGGTKMRGLLKYLRQTLQVPVERPDSFKRLAIAQGVSAAKFHENVADFGVVYGLALQGLDLGRIESNLLPRSVARSMAWAGKAKYFTAAACLLLLASIMCFARTNLDTLSYSKAERYREKAVNVIKDAKQASSRLKEEKSKAAGYEVTIKKAFEPFAYRDVVPLLHQTIISILPNGRNNLSQKDLYEAFVAGNVEKVKETPRKERKQIFVTGMSVRFVEDVEYASLGGIDLVMARAGEDGSGLDERALRELEVWERYAKYRPKMYGDEEEEVRKHEPGFVVSVEGYSPYKNLGELMDPYGVENEPDKWGVITRLSHLNDIMGGKSPFELFGKTTDTKHFKLDTGAVELDTEMPLGIGVVEFRYEKPEAQETPYSYGTFGQTGEPVLIDPMTKEPIGKAPKSGRRVIRKPGKLSDIEYEVHDHWFVLKFKVVWKEAPKDTVANAATSASTGGAGWKR